MVYSRIVRAVGAERFSPTPLRWTTVLFVLGDFACLYVHHTAVVGSYIVVAGLLLQVLLCGGFMGLCRVFHARFLAHLDNTSSTTNAPGRSRMMMLYATSLAILVRNVFRVVEFSMGPDSYVFSSEWLTYLLDGALMLILMIGFLIWHPGQLQYKTRESAMELSNTTNRAVTE